MIAGIIGLLLPVMPGWLFVFIGLSMIAPASYFQIKYRLHQRILRKDVIYFEEWKKELIGAGVTTKHFPVFFQRTDDLDDVGNREKLTTAFASSHRSAQHQVTFSGRFAYGLQVHGDNIAVLEDGSDYQNPGFYRFPATDGLITNIHGMALLIMTADCLSIFLKAPGWVGLVHAGWRGTQKGIVKKTALLLMQRSGCKASQIQAIFGPAICARHYQVGEEFKANFVPPSLKKKGSKYYLNLAQENKQQLLGAGISAKDLFFPGFCTVSDNASFYSFRKEKDSAGRTISFIQIGD